MKNLLRYDVGIVSGNVTGNIYEEQGEVFQSHSAFSGVKSFTEVFIGSEEFFIQNC